MDLVDYSGKTCRVTGTWTGSLCDVSGKTCSCEPEKNPSTQCKKDIACSGVPSIVNGKTACYEDAGGALGSWGKYKEINTYTDLVGIGAINLPGSCDPSCGFQYTCDALQNSDKFEMTLDCTDQENYGPGCAKTPTLPQLCNCIEDGGNCISNYNSDSEAGKEFPDVKLNECQRDNLL